ncbi:polysaccharide biosynthesis C-terminal domain-containing protein [Microcoleus sp. FACHB-831]|uniref:murein biosynthesis integral membrane protein MurJ n=1 Tax=Microcoleus sp. FACHB-831 TaxID=2692827 RepID=UPI001686F693|nr:lipid II flippase MurJ [Microcoleus sp. FACHB-831]MBD1920406.1 polysaccharide biosynthesis C-terminal domain-containing protein [Microcoleus sp. FACHB-831]
MKSWQLHKLVSLWKQLTNGSINRKIFGAAVTVGLWTAVVKMASFGKEFIVAWRFGTGDDIDAFLIALLVPSFLINVVAGSFNAAMIPTYIRVREQEGKEAAQRLFSGVMVWSLGLLAIATFLMVVTAPFYLPLIARGFSPEKLDLTYRLLWIIAPVLMVSGIQVIWGAVLNAGERFALAALTPIITPTCSAILLLTCRSWGIFALATGLVCGALLEMTLLGIALKRQKISLLPKWYGFDERLRQVSGQYAPMIAGAFFMSSTTLVDQSMAAMLSPGSVAALNYGSKVIAFPLGLTSTALATAIIPYFAKMVACDDWAGVRDTLKRYIFLVFAVTIPLTLFFVFYSETIIQVLLQRGSFTIESVPVVARIQAFYACQIPFYVAGVLIAHLILSLRKSYILSWAAGFNLLTNIILNYLFVQWFGLPGIALSTTCVYILSLLLLSLFLHHNWQNK